MRIRVVVFLMLAVAIAPSAIGQVQSSTPIDDQPIDDSNEEIRSRVDLSAGLNIFRGNVDLNSADFGASGQWDWYDSRLSAFGHYAFGSARLADQVLKYLNEAALGLAFSYRFFVEARGEIFTTHAADEFRAFDYRTTNGIGGWYDLSADGFVNSAGLFGVIEYELGKNTLSDTPFRLWLRDIVTLKLSEEALWVFEIEYLPALSEFTDFRALVGTSIEAPIVESWLSLRSQFTFERDNHPQPGVEKNDTRIVTSLVVKF